MKQRILASLLAFMGLLWHSQSNAQNGGCIPQSGSKAFYIENVRVRQPVGPPIYENPSGATPYSDYSGNCVPYNFGLPNLVFSVTGNQAGYFYAIWVDGNDNNVFENGELVVSGGPTGGTTINVSFFNIPLGNHLVRVIVSGAAVTDPCANLVSGETEDYCLNFGCVPAVNGNGVFISDVRIRDFQQVYYDNPTGADGYSDYTNPCHDYLQGSPGLQFSVTANVNSYFMAVYVDQNDNGIFEPGELVNGGPVNNGSPTFNLSFGGIAPGSHKVRVIVSDAPITGPCDALQNGETEDYCLNFGCAPNVLGNGVFISNVRIHDGQTVFYNNSTGADGYSDYTDPCQDFLQGAGWRFSVTANVNSYFMAIYVDQNDNGIFEPGELVNGGPVNNGSPTFNLSFAGIAPGNHKVRVIVSDAPVTGPCDLLQNGETEDYCLNFGCVPTVVGNGVFISDVRIRDFQQVHYDNPTGADGYSDYTDPCQDYVQGAPGLVFSVTANVNSYFVAIYVDQNDNGIFEPGELVNGGPVNNGSPTFNLSFGGIAPGSHKVRVIVSDAPITGPCDVLQNGETEDYCLNFGCVPTTLNQDAWIARVYVGTGLASLSYDNPTGPSSYSDFTANCVPFDPNIPGNNFGIIGSQTGMFYAVYIDFNDDGQFDAGELYVSGGPLAGTGVNITMPTNLEGDHLVRVIMSRTAITGPCAFIGTGETEDYRLCFPCTPASTSQDAFISVVNTNVFGTVYYTNNTGASSYSNYTANCVNFNSLISMNLGVSVNMAGLYLAIYLDVNDNGIFEPGELLNPGTASTPLSGTGINQSLPQLSGDHLLRIIVSRNPITGPCDDIANGEIEDYRICYPCDPPRSQVQSIWISRVRVTSGLGTLYDNITGASSYSSYLSPCISIPVSLTQVNVNISTTLANRYIAVYIDYNGDGFFANTEFAYNGLVSTANLAVGVNPATLSGTNLMRIIYSSLPITGPCENVPNGEIEDYLICVDGGRGGKVADQSGLHASGIESVSLSVYPQPAHDHVTLDFSISRDEAVSIEVRDIHGKLLMTPLERTAMQAGNHSLRLSTEQLSAGMYLVTLHSLSGSKTSKLVIE